MAITTEQIMKAADELDREGQNPTLARVRKKLGGGSFTTISEVMIEWRAQKTHSAPTHEPHFLNACYCFSEDLSGNSAHCFYLIIFLDGLILMLSSTVK
ncbi:hypothetical protein FJ875_23625 [Salmonella enterica]|nr:hypothetical protein [Salmonella enterica]